MTLPPLILRSAARTYVRTCKTETETERERERAPWPPRVWQQTSNPRPSKTFGLKRAPLLARQVNEAMTSHNKRGRAMGQDDGGEEREREAKERRTAQSLHKIETQLNAGFTKLHSTAVLLSQAKANLEMIGGLVCRQKDEIKQTIDGILVSRRGQAKDVKLTVVAEAAYQKYLVSLYQQRHELNLVEEAIANAHKVVAEDNVKRSGPWTPLPPIREKPDIAPRPTPSR